MSAKIPCVTLLTAVLFAGAPLMSLADCEVAHKKTVAGNETSVGGTKLAGNETAVGGSKLAGNETSVGGKLAGNETGAGDTKPVEGLAIVDSATTD